MGKGKGGGDRFERMAAQRDAMSQKVIDALAELAQVIKQSGGGGGGGSSGGPNAGPAPTSNMAAAGVSASGAAGGGFWSAAPGVVGGASVSGSGDSSSIAQRFLSAGGLGMAAQAAAGPVGLAAASIGFGVNAIGGAIQRAEDVRQAGYDARENAPLHESEVALKYRENIAKSLKKIDEDEESFFGPKSRILYSEEQRDAIKRANVDQRRLLRGELEDFERVERDTASRVERFFAPFAAGGKGALPSGQQVDELIKFYKPQMEAQWQLRKMVEERTSYQVLSPGSVGTSSKK